MRIKQDHEYKVFSTEPGNIVPVNGPTVLQQLAVIMSISHIIIFSFCYSQGEKLRGEEAFISRFIMAKIWEQSKSLLNTGMDN